MIIPLFKDERITWDGILLLHLNFVPEAPVQQKVAILRGMGSRYHELLERLQEISETRSLEQVIESISPRDLVLAPLEDIAPESRGSK